MEYSVTFFCPDSHLTYDLKTVEEKGVGGGVTARIRLAHAFADLGHKVTIYNNCPGRQIIQNVQYLPVDLASQIESDVFIAGTSGDGLDLSGLVEIDLCAKLKILMAHGVDPPDGVSLGDFDYIYALSNFVRDRIVSMWEVPANKVFTTHRGITEDYYYLPEGKSPKRDPFGIVYASHPSKGMASAIKILDILRRDEPRFSLHIYGGYQLWGDKEEHIDTGPNLICHGLIGQRALAYELQRYCYALHIQDRKEPFGISLIEAMRAGCIVLASSVGAFPEIIQSGHNGFLINGRSSDELTHKEVSQIILDLARNEDLNELIRTNAISSPHSWRTIAETWEGHWNWVLNENAQAKHPVANEKCPACASDLLYFPDGFHCTACGRYHKNIGDS